MTQIFELPQRVKGKSYLSMDNLKLVLQSGPQQLYSFLKMQEQHHLTVVAIQLVLNHTMFISFFNLLESTLIKLGKFGLLAQRLSLLEIFHCLSNHVR